MSKNTLALTPISGVTYAISMLHDQRANMSHSVAYILQHQETIVAEIPPGGGGAGSIAMTRSIRVWSL